MRSKMIKALLALFVATTMGAVAQAGQLDQKSATVSMNVGVFAAISGLGDITLATENADGAEGAVYTGSDTFVLKSNAAVSVAVEGTALVNGENKVGASYQLDDSGASFSTAAGIHNGQHTVAVAATLGDISDQEAGSYAGSLTVTVSAL